MVTWITLHVLPSRREIDVNLARVAVLRRLLVAVDGTDTGTRVDFGDWNLEVQESLEEIRALQESDE